MIYDTSLQLSFIPEWQKYTPRGVTILIVHNTSLFESPFCLNYERCVLRSFSGPSSEFTAAICLISHKCQELIADTGDHLRTAGAKTREVRPFLRWTGNDSVRGRLFISSRYLAVCTLFNRSIIYLHDMDQSYSVNYFSVRLYLNSSWAKANLTITLVMEHFSLN